MINIVIQKLKDQFRGIIYYLIALIGYAWMIVGLYPTIGKNNFEELMKNYPEELLKFFGGSDALSFSKIEGFLSMEYLSLFFVLIITFYIAASAGSAIAGTIEKHQMDFTLSQPISRTKLVLGETLVGAFYSLILVTLTSLSIWLFCLAYDVTINEEGILAFAFIATIFIWAIYGIAIFLSSFMKSKIAVTGLTAAIVMGSYVFASLSNMVEKMERFKEFSLFYLYKPQNLLETANISWNQVGILFSIFAIGVSGAILIFNKRDV